jgi:hypothetical protein
MVLRGNYRTLTATGEVEPFDTRRETERRAQTLANETGDWVGVQHFQKGDPTEPDNDDAWLLLDTRHPITSTTKEGA